MLSPRALLLLSAAAFALSGCATQAEPTQAPSPTPTPTAWEPAGAAAAITLTSPGDGGSRTIRVGDRVRIPPSPDFGGIRLNDWEGVLVPYGDDRTYLAVAPGVVKGAKTVYDEERPCVPPQPVAEFDLRVVGDATASMPPARHLSPDRAGQVVTVVPGQELIEPEGWNARVDNRDERLKDGGHGLFALRPGTSEVTLTRPRHEEEDITVKVRVIAPPSAQGAVGQPGSTSPGVSTGVLSTGANAAGPAALPHCG